MLVHQAGKQLTGSAVGQGTRFRCYDQLVLRDTSHPPLAVPERETCGAYTRKDVLRLLKIENRQLRMWERQQLVPELSHYRFSDLLLLKRIAKLRGDSAPPKQIKQAQGALRKWMQDFPSHDGDVQVYVEGGRVRVQIGKHKLEPSSGQMLFDFAEEEIKKLLHLPPSQRGSNAVAEKVKNKIEADQWFERGLELEGTGAPFEQVIEAYTKASELDPSSAGALVNLGTVFFNGHAWADAEKHYKRALEVDADYALAHFNLANLFDEQDDSDGALHHYREAIRLNPRYADAHYNLALLYQGMRDLANAVLHWRAYLKIDAASAWAQIARRELGKLEGKAGVDASRPASRLQLVKSERA